jgi:hypothetical protein
MDNHWQQKGNSRLFGQRISATDFHSVGLFKMFLEIDQFLEQQNFLRVFSKERILQKGLKQNDNDFFLGREVIGFQNAEEILPFELIDYPVTFFQESVLASSLVPFSKDWEKIFFEVKPHSIKRQRYCFWGHDVKNLNEVRSRHWQHKIQWFSAGNHLDQSGMVSDPTCH